MINLNNLMALLSVNIIFLICVLGSFHCICEELQTIKTICKKCIMELKLLKQEHKDDEN